MTSSQPERRFLGRPDQAYPGFVPGGTTPADRPDADARARPRPRSRSAASRLWLIQALTGTFLIAFLGVHLVAQHFLAPGGLRDYEAVVAYLREPLALAAELGLLLSVIVHACVGMRSAMVDVVSDGTRLRLASVAIGAVGTLVAVYALWVTVSVIAGTAPP
jgi:succinate dehydrogenase hydrophobic anchor subunit